MARTRRWPLRARLREMRTIFRCGEALRLVHAGPMSTSIVVVPRVVRAALALVLAGASGAALPQDARAAELDWAIMPARGARPPPRDPTLTRLTDALSEAIGAALGVRPTVIGAALAEDACPGDSGECPRDVAILVGAKRLVTIELREDHGAATLRLYAPKVGRERVVTLACKWSEGLVVCDGAGLEKLAATPAPSPPPVAEPSKPTKGKPAKGGPTASPSASPADTTPEAITRAFHAAAPRLTRCKKAGWGDLAPSARPTAVSVRFRVAADGVLRDVRIDPTGLLDVPALACMARVVESIELEPGAVDDAVRTQPLPLP